MLNQRFPIPEIQIHLNTLKMPFVFINDVRKLNQLEAKKLFTTPHQFSYSTYK
jgi:hypothetical protein